jgi:D-sedoheptulose 7-phosphate isomerase
VTAALSGEDRRSDPTGTEGIPARAAAILAELERDHPELAAVIPDLTRAYRVLVSAYKGGGTLLLCGNGGSLADALHISGELLKSYAHARPLPPWFVRNLKGEPDGDRLARNLQAGLRAVVLGANQALASAVENDMPDRNMRYAQELLALARTGDVVLAISTSGNASSVVYAVEAARALGLTTLALTGSAGGRLADLVDVPVRAPADRTDRVQEIHIRLYHTLCEMLELTFFEEDAV